MKDADNGIGRSIVEDTERFQESFSKQQTVIEELLTESKSLPPDQLKEHFSKISALLTSLQQLYSSSSPYLRIYDRKICQDSLQLLHSKLQDTEKILIPRKKFAFKGSKNKVNASVATNGTPTNAVNKETTSYEIDDLNDCVFRDRIDEVVVVPASVVSGKAVLFSRLKNCTVQVLGSPSTIHITDAVGCSVSCGPVATSVFVEGVHTCIMQLACQQLRIHQSTDTDFRIHVTSKAIIEDSNGLRFGVYSFRYPTLEDDYKLSGLRRDVNNWFDVDDFNWLVTGEPSPNWSLIKADNG